MAEVLEFNDMFYTNFEPKMKNRFIFDLMYKRKALSKELVRGLRGQQRTQALLHL